MKRAHDDPIASHMGISKTLDLLWRNFYWPGMVRNVRDFVRNCDICKWTKAPNIVSKPTMGKQIETERPFQRMYVDILGPYPQSRKGHIGLLIVLDHFSKFYWLCPLRKFSTNSITECYIQVE